MSIAIRVFDYLEQLDAFVITRDFEAIATELGLIEWTPVVWIGRLLTLDNDYGEHWFDNWDERESAERKAREPGIEMDSDRLMIVVPSRFADGRDGPCHSPEFRKRFWTDVLKSLALSLELLFDEARQMNEVRRGLPPEHSDFLPLPVLEERIQTLRRRHAR